jgi:guanylate kinase
MAHVIVITGPSGVGKGTVIRLLRERMPSVRLSISATTRAPRPGEQDQVDYHFLGAEQFDALIAEGAFAEHARYAGQLYGTLRSELEESAGEGDVIVLEIELQGARQIRESMPAALQVFIAPPSFETLRERLVGRGTDSAQTIDERLAVAREELGAQDEFSEVIVNDRLGDAVDALELLVQGQLRGAVD